MIVKSARFRDDQVRCLVTLAGVQHSHRIDLDTQVVLRMRIRRHIVTSRIVVHEQHARALRDVQLRRVEARRGNGDRRGRGSAGGTRRRAPATRRHQDQETDDGTAAHARNSTAR